MKKLIITIVLFLHMVPSFDGGLQITPGKAVYAQPCPPDPNGGGGGGFWGWLGGLGQAIGDAVNSIVTAISDFFSGDGDGGEDFGEENSDDDWNINNDGSISGGDGGFTDPYSDPYFDNYFDQDIWDLFNNLGVYYTNYQNNTPPCATAVVFNEDVTQKYGYDNFTNSSIPWKSVEESKTDNVKVAITPASMFSTVFFKNLSPTNLTINPTTTAPSANFNFTTTATAGTNKVETEVQANCASVDGTNISKMKVVSYTMVTKTVNVTLVHSQADPTTGYTGYTSQDVSDAAIIDYLNNKSYNQGVVKWTIHREPDLTLPFDINQDYKLDDNIIGGGLSPEMQSVVTGAVVSGYDINLILVDNYLNSGNLGLSPTPGSFSFVKVAGNPNVLNSITHELGHAQFGFPHKSSDPDNFMYDFNQASRLRFRKDQWDAMH